MTIDTVDYRDGHWEFFEPKNLVDTPLVIEQAQENFHIEVVTMIKRPENIVLAFVGCKHLKEGVGELWLFPSKHINKYSFSFFKTIKTLLDRILGTHLFRLQMTVDTEYTDYQKFAEKLGFKKEGIMEAFDIVQGEPRDHVLYSIVRLEEPCQQPH